MDDLDLTSSPAAIRRSPQQDDERSPLTELDASSGPHAPDTDEPRYLVRSRRTRNLQAAVMLLLAVGGLALMVAVAGVGLSLYGVVAVGYLAVKLGLSIRYRPATEPVPRTCSVGAIVPFYNEDPEALRACIESLLDQSHPVERIIVVDDGSTVEHGLHVALQVLSAAEHPGAVVHRLSENRGKRHAQAWALERLRTEIVLTVDSDTVLHHDAVREGLRAFADPDVQGVTGNVQALNAGTNLLTKLTSLRYANAFLWERAAYSSLGSVLCACGSLSLWRRELLEQNLDDYLGQSFLGVPVMYGDDRRLTNYGLRQGKVLFQDTAVAYTTVPERFGHYARQQARWNRSFFRESLWALRHFRPWTSVWLLSFSELALWAWFTTAIVAVFVVYPAITGELPSAWYLAFVGIMAYARSIRYLGSQRTSLSQQVGVFLLAPLYGLLYLLVLMPIRVWALLHLRQPGWGTREHVEVRLGA